MQVKRGWFVAGIAAALLVGVVAVAQAAGPWGQGAGYGMMDGHGGRGGMMGGGTGMMGGRGGMMGYGYGNGANYDPATALTRAQDMLQRQKDRLAVLQSRLAAATDAIVKADLTADIERQQLLIGQADVHFTVLNTQPKTWNEACLATAQAEVTYWGQANATDPVNKAWANLQLELAKRQVTRLQAQQTTN
jgi:hypothetical protein